MMTDDHIKYTTPGAIKPLSQVIFSFYSFFDLVEGTGRVGLAVLAVTIN